MKPLPFGGCPEVACILIFLGTILIAAPTIAYFSEYETAPKVQTEVKKEKRIKKIADWLTEEVE